jgi:peptide/nickel transport system permease protein
VSDSRIVWGGGFLALLALLAVAAPWLPLRDPAAQPDTTVLRDLPPLARVHGIVLSDGSWVYAAEVVPLAAGSVRFRRDTSWSVIEASALHPDGWHRRPRFLLGTDSLGRDLLSRMVHGARASLLVGLIAALVALVIGALVGTTAGLGGGWIDAALMRLTDLVLAVPRLFLALMLAALWGPSLTTTVVVIGSTTWMAAARLVRGEILSSRERDYIHAARAAGAPLSRLSLRHLLPSAIVPLLVEGALRVGDTILLEAALSFLGFGVQPPDASWGNLIADGRYGLPDYWWGATLPGAAIAVTVIALNFVGDAVRERLQGGRAA